LPFSASSNNLGASGKFIDSDDGRWSMLGLIGGDSRKEELPKQTTHDEAEDWT
jgi:hypothetical protein